MADIFSTAVRFLPSWPAFFQTLIYFADSFEEEFLIVDFFPEHAEYFVSEFDFCRIAQYLVNCKLRYGYRYLVTLVL